MINKTKREKIIDQSLREISFARQYKQGIVDKWHKNENLYYGRKDFNNYYPSNDVLNHDKAQDSRANVNIASSKAMAFVETVLSKIDSPLTFKFKKNTMADLKRAKLLNALKEKDSNDDDWNFKDLMGKVEAIMYGRAIFTYYADSLNGYCPHLENVSVYDFLIDPSGGGFDPDKAMYCGRYDIKRSKSQLQKGRKEGIYIKDEVDKLISGSGNDANQTSQEDINKQNKYSYIAPTNKRTINNPDMWKLWEWYTTYDGERYYLLMEETSGIAIRVEKLKDMFPIDKRLGDAMFPFWSYAFMPNITEFWTPSKLDYVREPFMTQSVSINQMVDNAERINKPQRAVDVGAIESVADLIYRKNGVIRVKPGTDINKAFRIVETPSISTPITVYNTLENINNVESGINAASKGVAEEDKVGIYQGNQANTADRYGVWNKSYSQGYKRFSKLWRYGVDSHLTLKVGVKILGSKGLEETFYITKRDIKPSADWDVIVDSTDAETQADAIDTRNKLTFLQGYRGDQTINQKAIFEESATVIGFTNEQIRTFMDVSEFGDSELLSEAERDIESLLDKKIIEPNMRANTAYMKHIVDYMIDHKEDMTDDQFTLFTDYVDRLEEFAINNAGTQMTNQLAKEGLMGQTTQEPPVVSPSEAADTIDTLSNNQPAVI